TSMYVLELRKILSKIQYPGAKIMVRQSAIKGIMGNKGADISLKLRGPEINKLNTIGAEIAEEMKKDKEFENITFGVNSTRPEFQIIIDRIKAAELGISANDIGSSLRTIISGATVSYFRDNNVYYDIVLNTKKDSIVNINQIENIIISGSNDNFVRLKNIAKIKEATGPVEIIRENQSIQITIDIDANANLSKAVNRLREILNKQNMPVGYEYTIGGNAEMMGDMRNTIFQVFIFALFFSFTVLAVQFNNLKLPTMILFSIPVCLSGVVLILLFCNIFFRF
ncbi:MAG: efflux RND transporter permease subunit, partial [Candidatus Muiribacteriota bacterium]